MLQPNKQLSLNEGTDSLFFLVDCYDNAMDMDLRNVRKEKWRVVRMLSEWGTRI